MTKRIGTRLWIILSLAVVSLPLAAQSLDQFSEQIFLESDGTARVVWSIMPAGDTLHTILLPWNFPLCEGMVIPFQVHNADTVQQVVGAQLIAREGIHFVRIGSRDHSTLHSLRISFSVEQFYDFKKEKIVDFGNFIIKKRFINTSVTLIDNFSSELVLPPDFVVTSVDETIPKQTEENSVSPFTVQRTDGRNSVVVHTAKMKLGEHAFIKMQAKSEAKSPVLFIAMVFIGILYAVFFRDLIKKREYEQHADKT